MKKGTPSPTGVSREATEEQAQCPRNGESKADNRRVATVAEENRNAS
jgi:hypothetical protein